MDESQVRNIVNDILTQSQYGVARGFYHLHTGVDSPKIEFSNLNNAPNFFCVAIDTNGVTAVPVFGAKGWPTDLTITGMFLTSKDSTAGNITLMNNGTTATVVAKSVTPSAMSGATSITHTSYTAGNSLTVVSSSTGNATVFLTFTT